MYGRPRLLPTKPVCFRRDIFRLSREIRRTCENCWRQGSRHIFAHGARRHRVDVVRHCSAHARSLSRPLEGSVRFEWFSSAQWARKWAVVFQTKVRKQGTTSTPLQSTVTSGPDHISVTMDSLHCKTRNTKLGLPSGSRRYPDIAKP